MHAPAGRAQGLPHKHVTYTRCGHHHGGGSGSASFPFSRLLWAFRVRPPLPAPLPSTPCLHLPIPWTAPTAPQRLPSSPPAPLPPRPYLDIRHAAVLRLQPVHPLQRPLPHTCQAGRLPACYWLLELLGGQTRHSVAVRRRLRPLACSCHALEQQAVEGHLHRCHERPDRCTKKKAIGHSIEQGTHTANCKTGRFWGKPPCSCIRHACHQKPPT